MTAAAPPRGAFRVAERVYGEPDEFGHKQLLHAAGAVIPWTRAVDLGLVAEVDVPDGQVIVQTPVSLYDDDGTGGRVLVHRAGSMIPADEFERLRPRAAEQDSPDSEPPPERERPAPAERSRPGAGQRTRTTKQPGPDGR